MNLKSLPSILGMFLCNSVGGCINLAGTMSTYILSYYHPQNPDFTLSSIVVISFIAITVQVFNFFLITRLTKYLREFSILFLGLFTGCLLIVICSFVSDPFVFVVLFGVALGIVGSNLIFPSVWICQRVVSFENKSFVTGIGLASFAISPLVYSSVFALIINPENRAPEETSNEEGIKIYLYDKSIADRFPVALQYFSLIIFIVGLLGILCFYEKHPNIHKREVSSTMTLKNLTKTHKFWKIFLIDYLKMLSFLFIINVYKAAGFQYAQDKNLVTFTSLFGFSLGACFRVVFGKLLDKFSWSTLNSLEALLETVLYTLYAFSLPYPILFSILTIFLICFSNIAHLTIWVLTDQLFPNDKWIFSVISIANPFALLTVYLLTQFIIPSIGYFATCLLLSSTNFLALMLIFRSKHYFSIPKSIIQDETLLK